MTVNEISKAIEQHTLALLSSNLQPSSDTKPPLQQLNQHQLRSHQSSQHQSSQQQPKLVLAYSGGVDSECLAYGLSAFAQQHPHIPCLLVHVHHGLSKNAETWVEHCLTQANKYQLPIQIERVKLTKSPRQSLEAIARDARYSVFKKYLNQGDILLTAHHQDDQLETVLLALKRGQGPKGLAAMGAIQCFNQHSWIVRPLLDISRAQIESFASSVKLKHIEDESNQDEQFDRNFLRQDIIPRLKQRWPSIAVTAARSANLCAQQQLVIEQEVNNRLPAFIDTSVSSKYPAFKLMELKNEPAQWQSLLFRGYIQSQQFSLPSQSQLEQILEQVLNAADDAKVDVHCGDYSIKRFAGHAYIVPVANESCLKAQQAKTIDELSAFIIASGSEGAKSLNVQEYQVKLSHDGVRLRLPNIDKVAVVFGAKGSTRCQPHFRDKGRELKKIWQALAI
ncbi:tRNA lysidine(34) synthetase TilS, partial [Shewanella sp. TC10]|uniref:tRNA lysidine(34) synthetase TilS n=1 Tax=Shewanella sp. TC10 TaxID=1419739 RepID=UPI00129DEC44